MFSVDAVQDVIDIEEVVQGHQDETGKFNLILLLS